MSTAGPGKQAIVQLDFHLRIKCIPLNSTHLFDSSSNRRRASSNCSAVVMDEPSPPPIDMCFRELKKANNPELNTTLLGHAI